MAFDIKLARPKHRVVKPPDRAQISDVSIVTQDAGLLARIEELERKVAVLESGLAMRGTGSDLIPSQEVDAETFYETASDGTLRAGVAITIDTDKAVEVVLLDDTDKVTFVISHDAYVDAGNPDSNYGTSTELWVQGLTPVRWTYCYHVWGGYPSSGLWAADIVAAWLAVYCDYTILTDTFSVDIVSCDPFVETTITWNRKPVDLPYKPALIDRLTIDPDYTGWLYLDVTNYIWRCKQIRAHYPNHLAYCLRPTYGYGGAVRFQSREATNPPKLIYWTKTYQSRIITPRMRTVNLYGRPGGTYWLTYRFLDENNVPGKWAPPVQITLPSQGEVPSAPTLAYDYVDDTCTSAILTISLTPPADFSHFTIEERWITNDVLCRTFRVDANTLVFPIDAPGAYKYRAKTVTRSGLESPWSAYVQAPEASTYRVIGPSTQKIELDSSENIVLDVSELGEAYWQKFGVGQYRLLKAKSADVPNNALYALVRGADYWTTDRTTTSTVYVNLANVAYTPPGTGTARIFLIATFLVNRGSNTRVTFRWGYDTAYTSVMGWWEEGPASITLTYYFDVPAGTSHTFRLQWATSNGLLAMSNFGLLQVIDVGRY
jgi:hypothetical protein